MIAGARTPLAYVDPFGLVCLGLGCLAPATTDLGRDSTSIALLAATQLKTWLASCTNRIKSKDLHDGRLVGQGFRTVVANVTRVPNPCPATTAFGWKGLSLSSKLADACEGACGDRCCTLGEESLCAGAN